METRRFRTKIFCVTSEQVRIHEFWSSLLLNGAVVGFPFTLSSLQDSGQVWSLVEISCFRIASRKGLLICRKTVFIFYWYFIGSSFDNCWLVKLFTGRYLTLSQAKRHFSLCKKQTKSSRPCSCGSPAKLEVEGLNYRNCKSCNWGLML